MLTKKQFDVLTLIERTKSPLTQRDIGQRLGMSLGMVNKSVAELTEKGLLHGGQVTAQGYDALEPYRVKRAVVFAAGFGSRLIPITLNTPKPLVRVKGTRIIDSMLDAIYAAGISEVYIVRGYLAEQFDQLLYKYPNIRFIENPLFNEANNISSALYARHLLQNAYVCEADLLLYNPELITKYQYQSNYLGVPVEMTHDWCLYTKGGYVSRLAIGGTGCYHMFGISYWDEADGARLSDHIMQVFSAPGGKERYWDQVALEYHIGEYRIAVRPCTFDDIAEIDTYQELKNIDSTYI